MSRYKSGSAGISDGLSSRFHEARLRGHPVYSRKLTLEPAGSRITDACMATTSSQSKNKVFVMMELEDDLARKDLEGNVQFRAGEAAAHKKFFSDPGISAGKIRSTGCLPSDTNRSALMLGTANERLSVSL